MVIIFTWKDLIVKNSCGEVLRVPAHCEVRTELNGRRYLHDPGEVVHTLPRGGKPKPYMPRQFPGGVFDVEGVEYTDDPVYAPVKIRTNATRNVFIWELDDDGGYDHMTEEIQEDAYYLAHHSNSRTSLGCIIIDKENDALVLAALIEKEIESGKPVYLEVL